MPPVNLLLIGFLAILFLATLVALVLVARRRRQGGVSTIEDRLIEYTGLDEPVTLQEIELSASFSERIVYPLIDSVSGFAAQLAPARALEKARHRLELADNPGNLTPANFMVIRFVTMIVLGGVILALMLIGRAPLNRRILFTVVVTILGFYLPVLWLTSRIKRRQREITKQLPDTLDLLTICVEAGLGLDQAVQRVVDKSDNELSRALARYLQETRLGRARREALQTMADRIEVSDVTTFVAAVIQATDLGVSMARILRVQSDQMRVRRRQRAEQEAQRAPLKMAFPLAFLIFPAILIVLLGPAGLALMETLGSGF
jgi:tight adherence protein C